MRSLQPSHQWAIRALAVALLVAAVTHHASAQTTATVSTKDGKEYRGRVVNEGSESLTLIGTDSVEVKVPRSQIRSINYTDSATAAAAAIAAAPIPEKTSFPVAGVALGTPAGLNGIVGYYFNGWGVRLTGMYFSSVSGLQINAVRSLGRSGNFAHYIHLGVGTLHIELEDQYGYLDIRDWQYAELGYDFNWNGFFVSGGLSLGSGGYDNPQPMFQLGYAKEFR